MSASSGWRARPITISAVIWLVVALVVGPSVCLCAAERELPKVRFVLAWGKKGTEPGEFHFPIGIAIDRTDVILVTDHYNHRVQRFDREGKLLGLIPVLPNPGGIALDGAGNIYLSHFPASVRSKAVNPDRLSRLQSRGQTVARLGQKRRRPGRV